ncbi:MAG TPA: FHA domain-containing protein, partial [Polyangiaceae bacterium]|nr:FHA domain-containing protein [Polyangiaceae bacterium]
MTIFRLRHRQHDLELPPGQFLIGRSTDCQLAIEDVRVSRRHAQLLITDEAVYVEDLGSQNGISVDGELVRGRQRLRHGSRLTVGGQDMVLVDTRREPITASGVRTLADHSAPPSPQTRPPLSPRVRVAPTLPDAAAFA